MSTPASKQLENLRAPEKDVLIQDQLDVWEDVGGIVLHQGHFGIEKTRELVAKECYATGILNTYPLLDRHKLRFDPYCRRPA